MKNLLYILLLLFVIGIAGGCGKSTKEKLKEEPHRMIKEIVIDYHKGDLDYDRQGIYRRVIRKYNYKYRDSTSFSVFAMSKDLMHDVECWVNEYGDTIMFEYIEYYGYPPYADYYNKVNNK